MKRLCAARVSPKAPRRSPPGLRQAPSLRLPSPKGRVDYFNTHCALLRKKNRGAASDLLRGCAARRPLAPPHLRCSLPAAARLAYARHGCLLTHLTS